MKIRIPLYFITHFGEFLYSVQGMRNQDILSTPDHLRLSAEWLLTCQDKSPDGGYSAFYSLITGWSKGYPETSGYIIPTMLDTAELLKEPRYKQSALKVGEWLLKVQREDGAYSDTNGCEPYVFDTGQVLLGLSRLYRETKDHSYFEAAKKASDWLIRVQNSDGSWAVTGYYKGKCLSYHSRVAAALIEWGKTTKEERYVDAGKKNLEWVRFRQKENGFFQNAELKDGDNPVLHTMLYVLEGFLMAYRLTKEEVYLDALLKGAEPLRDINLNKEPVLHSQYDQSFNSTNQEKCISGLAQWAAMCLDIYDIIKDERYFEAAVLSIFYLKSKQLQAKGVLKGALPASVPLWRHYLTLSFTSWGVKFFADALIKYHKYKQKIWQEQELWVRQCFKLKLDGSAWDNASAKLWAMDYVILNYIEKILDSNDVKNLEVMDLGCGRGRYVKFFQSRHPNWNIAGIDPCYSDDTLPIQRGSAYNIPYPETYFDAVYTFIVLQHISDLRQVLKEIRRILKPHGVLIIGDRNLISGLGLLKPYHELRGKWIYPWDSPFLERWYTKGQWKNMLESSGFDVKKIYTLNDINNRGIKKLIRMDSYLLISARKNV